MFRTFLPLAFLIAATVCAQNRVTPEVSGGSTAGRRQQASGSSAQTPPSGQATTRAAITLDQAIQLAIANNPSLRASLTEIDQNQAQEVTANLRPNPTLSGDSQFVPIFNPSQFTSDTLDTLTQFDIGVGYLFERGGKRKRRLQAATTRRLRAPRWQTQNVL
jgi:outer membrane protein, heavy metal efflux system